MDTDEMDGSIVQSFVIETHAPAADLGEDFTPEERQMLASLRNRYQQGLGQFSDREVAGLRFLRWLHASGRLAA